MARYKHKNKGRFAGIPISVVKSDAYKSLSGNAAKLLTILACFYNSNNNGNLAITQSIIGEWMTKNTMYSAKDELHKKGFIVINAYGGRSAWGRKLPSLYGLTFQPMNELKEKDGELRFAHYPSSQTHLHYWSKGINPDYKTKKERDAQYKKDIKKIKKTNPYY
jgi:hypothetical protein